MKYLILKTCILTALSSVLLQAENLVINGDFETGTGPAFYQTTSWYNRGAGFNQGTSARSNDGVIEGSYSAIVNDRYHTAESKFGALTHSQMTKYKIQEGDSFSLTYQWRPADQYWQRSTDTVRFVLYATENDKAGGRVVWSSELTSEFFKRSLETAMPVSDKTVVVNSEAVDKTLFVMFYGVDTVNGGADNTPHWARVDNIDVEVIKAKPAPKK